MYFILPFPWKVSIDRISDSTIYSLIVCISHGKYIQICKVLIPAEVCLFFFLLITYIVITKTYNIFHPFYIFEGFFLNW